MTRDVTSRRRAALSAAAIVMAAAGLILVLNNAGSALIVGVPLDRPDAIVSLASHEWERLPVTAAIARRNPAALVLLTQPPVVTRNNCQDCGNRTRHLARLGVNPRRIVIVPISESSTWGEAFAIERVIRNSRMRRLAIVTSPYHTRRAFGVFRTVLGPDRIALGVVPAFAASPAQPARWWTAAYDRWYVIYEWCAIADYFARGRLPLT